MSLFNPRCKPHTRRGLGGPGALAALIAAAALLTACGYRPLYGQNSLTPQVERQLSATKVNTIPDRVGQLLRTALERRLKPTSGGAPQAYALTLNLKESIRELAVERSGLATRADLNLHTDYRLVRISDNMLLAEGKARAVASYNILNSKFATLTAQNDARERAVLNVADIIRTRLATYFHGPGAAQPALQSGQSPGNGYR